MKIIEKFSDSDWNDESLVRHKSKLEISTSNKSLQCITNKLEHLEPQHTTSKPNLSQDLTKALEDLEKDDTIIIKKADKSDMFVIMDTEFYKNILVLQDHLLQSTYEQCPANSDKKSLQKSDRTDDKTQRLRHKK